MLAAISIQASAQRINLKTNALYWLAETPNAGIELRLDRHFTLNMEAMVSFMNIKDYDVKGEAFTPELRYWFSARPQAGHFAGVMLVATHYDFAHKECHHNGDALGGGFTYGYSLPLGKRWSLEASAGVGLLHRKEKYYNTEKGETSPETPNNTKWMIAPLKASVSFVYILK